MTYCLDCKRQLANRDHDFCPYCGSSRVKTFESYSAQPKKSEAYEPRDAYYSNPVEASSHSRAVPSSRDAINSTPYGYNSYSNPQAIQSHAVANQYNPSAHQPSTGQYASGAQQYGAYQQYGHPPTPSPYYGAGVAPYGAPYVKPPTYPPGKNFLLVTGILGVIFNSIYTILGIILLIIGGMTPAFLGGSTLIATGLLYTIVAVFCLTSSILLIANRTRPEKAGMLKVLSIISIILIVLEMIIYPILLGLVGGAGMITFIFIFGMLLLLLIPIFALVGAVKNEKVYRSGASPYPPRPQQNQWPPPGSFR